MSSAEDKTSPTKTCYYPDHIADTTLRPCNPSQTSHGPCCAADAVCLTNGLCFNQDSYGNRIAKGGCTDEEWGASCPQYCENVRDRGFTLTLAETGGSDGGTFCCGWYNSTSKECLETNDGSKSPFPLTRGYVLFPNTSTPLESYLDSSVTTTPSTTTSCDYHRSDLDAAKRTVGIATGLSLGLPLLLALLLLLWQRRALSAAKKRLLDLPTPAAIPTESLARFENGKTESRTEKKFEPTWNELSIDQTVSEMPHEIQRQELEGHQ